MVLKGRGFSRATKTLIDLGFSPRGNAFDDGGFQGSGNN
jgi:hypothetical protein